jgi:hypothetical protein
MIDIHRLIGLPAATMGATWTHVLKHACHRAAQALPTGTQHGRLLQPLSQLRLGGNHQRHKCLR